MSSSQSSFVEQQTVSLADLSRALLAVLAEHFAWTQAAIYVEQTGDSIVGATAVQRRLGGLNFSLTNRLSAFRPRHAVYI